MADDVLMFSYWNAVS